MADSGLNHPQFLGLRRPSAGMVPGYRDGHPCPFAARKRLSALRASGVLSAAQDHPRAGPQRLVRCPGWAGLGVEIVRSQGGRRTISSQREALDALRAVETGLPRAPDASDRALCAARRSAKLGTIQDSGALTVGGTVGIGIAIDIEPGSASLYGSDYDTDTDVGDDSRKGQEVIHAQAL
jgi:hypothetical protein